MQDGNYPQRAFVGRIGYQVFADPFEPQRPGREIRAAVPLMRKRDKVAYRFEDVFPYAPSRLRVIVSDVFPDVENVLRRFRVKSKAPGACSLWRTFKEVFFTLAQTFKKGFAVDRFHPAALEIVIAAVQHAAYFCKFVNATGDKVLHQFIGLAPGPGGQIGQFLFKLRREMYFHELRLGRTGAGVKRARSIPDQQG